MPILLGLESAALAAAAYKWTPRAREKAKDWYGYAKQYLVSENEAKIATVHTSTAGTPSRCVPCF